MSNNPSGKSIESDPIDYNGSGATQAIGSAGNDTLIGTDGNDWLVGGAGDGTFVVNDSWWASAA